MNVIPATILDGFLDNPNTIRDWGKSLEFNLDPTNRWPGKRTLALNLLHPSLFNYINIKVLSLFFENPIGYQSEIFFQSIEGFQDKGWVHQDSTLFTFIIYLSKEDEINCGTTLYSLKKNKLHSINSDQDNLILDKRYHHHQTKSISSETQILKSRYEDSNFDETLNVKDKYNRLFCFSGENFHSANFLSNNTTPRLTLIGFVNKIYASNPPVIRSKQTLMM